MLHARSVPDPGLETFLNTKIKPVEKGTLMFCIYNIYGFICCPGDENHSTDEQSEDVTCPICAQTRNAWDDIQTSRQPIIIRITMTRVQCFILQVSPPLRKFSDVLKISGLLPRAHL